MRIVEGPASGDLVAQPDGSFIYTPELGFAGDVTFRYAASDGGLETEASVTITVSPLDVQLQIGDVSLPDRVFDADSVSVSATVRNTGSDTLSPGVWRSPWWLADGLLPTRTSIWRPRSIPVMSSMWLSPFPPAHSPMRLLVTCWSRSSPKPTFQASVCSEVSTTVLTSRSAEYDARVTDILERADGSIEILGHCRGPRVTATKKSFVDVEVSFSTADGDDIADVRTDGTGSFALRLDNVPPGLVTAAARHPEVPGEDAAPEAELRLDGIDFESVEERVSLTGSEEVTDRITLSNIGAVDLTGLTFTAPDLPAGWSFDFLDTPSTLNAGSSLDLTYEMSGAATSSFESFLVTVNSDQGATDQFRVEATFTPEGAELVADARYLDTTLAPGERQLVSGRALQCGRRDGGKCSSRPARPRMDEPRECR